jgi:hypothetical protein
MSAKEFIAVTQAVASLLNANSAGEFQVIDHEQFPGDAKDFMGKNRTVRVFYTGGKFMNHTRNRYDHDFELSVEMCVTAEAETDLSTLMNENATQAELAAAMASMRPSAGLVEKQFNELLGLVMDILGDPANQWLGLEKYRVKGNDFIEVKKDRLLPFGEYAVLTGVLVLGITVVEELQTSIVPSVRTGDTLTIEGEGD